MLRHTLLLFLGIGLLLATGCANPDSPSRPRTGIPAPLDPNRPSPNRTITRKVDNARSRVQQACAQMKALSIPQVGCDEAESILDLPGHLGAR